MCSRLLCPYLVCFLSSSSVIMSLSMFQPCLCDYVLITLCILVHACSVWFRLVYSLLPRCILSLSPALSCLVLPWCLIKDYYLSLCPRLRVPVPPSCVHRDRRPDLNSKRRPFTSFCFVRFLKSFYLFLCFVCPAARKSPLVILP